MRGARCRGSGWCTSGEGEQGVGDRGAHDQWGRLGTPTPHLTSPLEGGGMNWGSGGCWAGGSCLRRNDGWGRRNDGAGAGMTEGGGVGDRGAHDQWGRLGTPTPHLTSPLEGGGMNWGSGGCWAGGSCLRRNDGWGRRNDGSNFARGDGTKNCEHAPGSRFAQDDSSSGRLKMSSNVSRNCFSEMANLLALSLRSESAVPKRLRSSSAV